MCRGQNFSDMTQLAVYADNVMELHGLSSSPLSVGNVQQLVHQGEEESRDEYAVPTDGLVYAVGAAATHPPPPGQMRREGLCFFHKRFGEKANRCEKPCTWNSKNVQRAGRK